jgi:hypothetical protein
LLLIVTLAILARDPAPTLMPTHGLFVIRLGAPTKSRVLSSRLTPNSDGRFPPRAFVTVTPSKVTPDPWMTTFPDCTLKSKLIDLSEMSRELAIHQNPPTGEPSPTIVRRLKPTMPMPPQLPDSVIRFGPLRSVIRARAAENSGPWPLQVTVRSCRKPFVRQLPTPLTPPHVV